MTAIIVTLCAAVIAVMVLSVGTGAIFIAPDRIINIVLAHLGGGKVAGPQDYIVWELRMPRVVQAAAVGAALATAGSCVQVLVRNPLADPYVLGLSSGAGVAAVIVITSFGAGLVGAFVLPISAFLGAALAGVLVSLTAASRFGLSAGRLILSGVAIGQLLSGVMSFLLIQAGNSDATQQVVFWLLGSTAGAQWQLLAVIVPLIIVAVVLALLIAGRLDLLSLGDAHAAASGLRPGAARLVVFALASLLTGTAVAVSGIIGFVGLVVPHIARMLVGGVHRRVLPVSALLGGILLVLADLTARSILAPQELPIGIFTAAIGVPIFVLLMRRQRTVAFS